MVLHLDFKTNEPAHHQAIWELLGRHEAWLTTAARSADDNTVTPFAPGPLLVITEAGEHQVDTFHTSVPAGGRLRIFGTVPPATLPAAKTAEERAAVAVTATPETLIPSGATNYRRWTNFGWAVVEEGGQNNAGAWTTADDQRLRAIVSRAHALGLWVRFYTLNGHPRARARAGPRATTSARPAPGASACRRRATPASSSSPAISTRSCGPCWRRRTAGEAPAR